MQKTKVLISERGVIQRINRVLAKDDEVLKKSRGATRHQLGDFYIVDIHRNFVIDKDVNLEDLARKKGVLSDWEALDKEGKR